MNAIPSIQEAVMMETMKCDGTMLNVRNQLESLRACGRERGTGSDVEKSEYVDTEKLSLIQSVVLFPKSRKTKIRQKFC